MRQRTLRKKSSEVKAGTRRNYAWDGVIDQKSVGAKSISADGIVVNLDKCDVRGDML